MNTATILVVDDEPQLRRAMKATLTDLGYSVLESKTGEEALGALREGTPDLILLDLNMPGIGGLETCRAIRETSDVPIIVLSVRNTERDKVQALDAGADDYVTKPFGIQELLARIRAAMRRLPFSGESAGVTVVDSELELNFDTRTVTLSGRASRLTPKEYDLLKFLVDHANKPIAHRKLLQTVWGPDYGDEVEYLRVVVNQLRKKIEPLPSKPRYLLTEPWVGYRFSMARETPTAS
ncbi:MAG: response regulator transcription factor [Acidobacteriota bacterium]|nr:response regulator transcription factor [Acidobacteriota bacterium]